MEEMETPQSATTGSTRSWSCNVLDPDLALNYSEPPNEIFDANEPLNELVELDGTHVEANDYTPLNHMMNTF
jgi:hypothetical protein